MIMQKIKETFISYKNDTGIMQKYIEKNKGDLDKAWEELWEDNKTISIIFADSIYLLEGGDSPLGGDEYELFINNEFQYCFEGVSFDLRWILEETIKNAKEKAISINISEFNYVLRSLKNKQGKPIYNDDLYIKLRNRFKEMFKPNHFCVNET